MFKDKELARKVDILKEWAEKHEFQVIECPNCKHNTFFIKQIQSEITNNMGIWFTTSSGYNEQSLQCLTCGKYFKQETTSKIIEVKREV